MTKVTQREAVYQAVISVLAEAQIHLEDGQKAKAVMTKEHRAQVNTILAGGADQGVLQEAGGGLSADAWGLVGEGG